MDLCIIADCLHKIFSSQSFFPSNLSLPYQYVSQKMTLNTKETNK